MKKLGKLRKHLLTIWLVMVIVALTTVISYGAYTGVTSAKRVISLYGHDGILFTSRYMARTTGGVQPILFNYDSSKSDLENTPILMVDVCNYDSTDSVYGKNFKFKIKARIVHGNGTDITAEQWAALGSNLPQYSIAYKSYTDETHDLDETYLSNTLNLTYADQYIGGGTGTEYKFLAGDKTRYLFETKFDVQDVKTARTTYAIRIEAEVVEDYGDLANISGVLMAQKSGNTLENKWEGEYGDITENRVPADYDGINYVISGNTVGEVRLTYRSDVIVMDTNDYMNFSYSQQDRTVTEAGKEYTTLYISVNAESVSRYDIHFYWVSGKNSEVSFDDEFIKAEY
jgi:hypothetical protein